MRITIFCVGTRGDVQPFIGLGQALTRRGHAVTIATSDNFRADIERFGLGYAPLTADYNELMRRAPEMIEHGMNPFRVVRATVGHLVEMMEKWLREGLAAAGGADLLIGQGPATVLAASLSEALGIPVIQAQLQPMTPCRDIQPVALPPIPRMPGAVNLALYHVLRFFMWALVRGPINRKVQAPLGLRPYSWLGPQHDRPPEYRRVLYGYSRHIVPRSPDWGDEVAVTGFWVVDESATWTPPAELEAFLAAGEKPVYVGFGSMYGGDIAKLTRTVVDGIRKAGCRAVLASGWGGLETDETLADPAIFVLRHAPHEWLMPRMAGAVYHGGAGTTAAVVRAGIPALVMPFITEQAFWSMYLERLGVAAPRLDRKTVDADRLAAGLRRLRDPALRNAAAALGARVRAEDGADAAIRQLESWGLLRPADEAPPRRDRERHDQQQTAEQEG